MSSYDRTYDARRTMAAVFADRESALVAVGELQHAGFRSVRLAAASEARRGGSDGLYEMLVAAGLTPDDARRVDEATAGAGAVVTVNGFDYPDKATTILIDNGGRTVHAP